MQTVAIPHASNKYLFARMNVSQMIEFMGATIWDVCHKVKRVAWHKVFIWLVVPLKGIRGTSVNRIHTHEPKPSYPHHTELLFFVLFLLFCHIKWEGLVAFTCIL